MERNTNPPRALNPTDQAKVDALWKIRGITSDGYSGVMPNGNIVDRREHPEAIPIPKNSLLGVPKPKAVK